MANMYSDDWLVKIKVIVLTKISKANRCMFSSSRLSAKMSTRIQFVRKKYLPKGHAVNYLGTDWYCFYLCIYAGFHGVYVFQKFSCQTYVIESLY